MMPNWALLPISRKAHLDNRHVSMVIEQVQQAGGPTVARAHCVHQVLQDSDRVVQPAWRLRFIDDTTSWGRWGSLNVSVKARL